MVCCESKTKGGMETKGAEVFTACEADISRSEAELNSDKAGEVMKVSVMNSKECAAQTTKKKGCVGCLEAQTEGDNELATIRRSPQRSGGSGREGEGEGKGEDLGSSDRLLMKIYRRLRTGVSVSSEAVSVFGGNVERLVRWLRNLGSIRSRGPKLVLVQRSRGHVNQDHRIWWTSRGGLINRLSRP